MHAEVLSALGKQRQRHQGLGRAIESWVTPEGTRIVQVGVRRLKGKWKTFPDFLMDYIKRLFDADWGNTELSKATEERHPLLNLYQAVCAVQNVSEPDERGIRSSLVTGGVSLFYGLAYDLYCVEHNSNTQPVWDRLLHRLRTRGEFEQASYEALAGGAFARAGFSLDYEDDSDNTQNHVEFIATHSRTDRRFAVECKRRQDKIGNGKSRVVRHLNRAIGQNTTGLPLIAFIELDQPVQYSGDGKLPPHLRKAVMQIDRWASDPKNRALPASYVLLTNQPQTHFLSETAGLIGYLHGFKIPALRFRETGPLEDLVNARDAHPEVHELLRSLRDHSHFPNTFDGQESTSDSGLKSPLDYYDFMHDSYKTSSREQLLEFMKGWSDLPELEKLSQPELTKQYSIRWALNLLNHVNAQKT